MHVTGFGLRIFFSALGIRLIESFQFAIFSQFWQQHIFKRLKSEFQQMLQFFHPPLD